MKILTGNDLRSGAVVWWTGDSWSPFIEEAVDVGDRGEAIARREEAALRVNSPYVIEADRVDGRIRPAHIKERIRALGPTVHPHLGPRAVEPEQMNWVI